MNPQVILCTGGIGSGKSVVVKAFNLLGVPSYDCDRAAKELYDRDPQLLAGVVALAGEAVLGPDGRLAGIFTDGDFRRRMSEGGRGAEILGDRVESVMTRSPKFVRDDTYAAELLKVFERGNIDDLPVCDKDGRVAGLVDIQDLPKMKVL